MGKVYADKTDKETRGWGGQMRTFADERGRGGQGNTDIGRQKEFQFQVFRILVHGVLYIKGSYSRLLVERYLFNI